MNNFKLLFLITTFLMLNNIRIIAQEETTNTDDMFSMSLADLMNVEVVSATKSSMSIQKAPSVIRVFTEKDFESLGLFTLNDVLNLVPGIQMQKYRAGHQLVWTRGVQQRYNNKVLLLIDGVPMRDSYYGNFNTDEMIPLEAVEKIEVLNGPGSVLYGANSFAGVISITTKKEGRSVRANYGTYNSMYGGGEFDYKNLYVNASYFQTDGFQPALNTDGGTRTRDQFASNVYSLIKYQTESLKLLGSFTNYNYPDKYKSSKKDYSYHRAPMYLSAQYNRKITENGHINASAYYQYYSFNKHKIKYINETSDTLKKVSTEYMNTSIFGTDIDFTYNVKKHTLITGVSFQQDMANDMYANVTYDVDDGNIDINESIVTDSLVSRSNIGLFAQDMWAINDYIYLTTGVRYDVLSDFDNQFNYRVGLTAQSEKNIYGKLLYGTAFRVPSYREYLDVASFNPDLQPEHLKTLEVQAGYLFDKGDVNITFFNNLYSNFIQELAVDSAQNTDGSMREVDDEMAFNFNKRNISGLELSASLFPIKNLYVNIGASYLFNATEDMGDSITTITPGFDDQGEIDLVFLSDYTFTLTANYTIAKNYSLGFTAAYFSNRAVPDNYQADIDPAVQDFSNADGALKIDMYAKAHFFNKMDVYLKLNNILDEQIYSPPYGGSDAYDIEWIGFNFKVGATYKF